MLHNGKGCWPGLVIGPSQEPSRQGLKTDKIFILSMHKIVVNAVLGGVPLKIQIL